MRYASDRRSALCARRWVVVCGSIVVAGGLARLARAQEVLDGRDLGERGFVLEADANRSAIRTGVGLGDIDGDGFDDLAIAGRHTADLRSEFHLSIVYGRPDLFGRHSFRTLPRKTEFRFGEDGAEASRVEHVTSIGDLDRDGRPDFVFSMPSLSLRPELARGTAFLVYGSADFGDEVLVETIGTKVRGTVFVSSDPEIDGVGDDSALVGDFNGDGRDDFAISAPYFGPPGREGAGSLLVLYDFERLPPEVDLAEVGKGIPGTRFIGRARDTECCGSTGTLGGAVEPAGDVDGDGLADILVTARELRPRTVYLIRGRRDLPAVVDLIDLEGGGEIENVTAIENDFVEANRIFASDGQIAGAGDVNGDGFDDILVAASKQCCAFQVVADSEVFLFWGRREWPATIGFASLSPALGVSFRAMRAQDSFGLSIAGAGDLNGDGVTDFLFGSERASLRGQDSGEAYVFLGRPKYADIVRLSDGFEGIALRGEGSFDNLGSHVAVAGDFNGDGGVDFLILAQHHSNFSETPSRAYLVYGESTGDVPLRVHRVEPPYGPERGTGVLIRGAGFGSVPRVLFGGLPAGRVTVRSTTTLDVQAPPGVAGTTVDVRVEQDGESVTLASSFEYVPDLPRFDLDDLGRQGIEILPAGDERLGSAMAFVDLTGDGVEELVVASRTEARSELIVVLGGGRTPERIALAEGSARVRRISSRQQLSGGVGEVRAIGDVDGDGIDDLAFSAGTGTGTTVAFIVFGRARLDDLVLEDELLAGRAVRLERGSGPSSDFVFAPLGDVDGDLVDDFALALPSSGPAGSAGGEIVLVTGRRAWPEVFDVDVAAARFATLVPPEGVRELGRRLVAAGDVDGDGHVDLLTTTVADAMFGTVYLVFVRPELAGADPVAVESLVGTGGAVRFEIPFERASGTSALNSLWVAAAGNFDGDRFDDVLIGYEGGGVDNAGITFVVPGGDDLPSRIVLAEEPPAAPEPPELAGIVRVRGAPQTQSGSAAPLGDFNADGHDDFALRAASVLDGFDLAQLHGVVSVVFGGAATPATLDLGELRAHGLSIATRPTGLASLDLREVGDLDGDGEPDLAFIERRVALDAQGTETTTVFVVFGPFGGVEFVRGDANRDGLLNVADAVFTLSFLFTGGLGPECEDACDSDDGGTIELTDAVYFLLHLFLGGPPPPMPFPEAGRDPSDDVLGCRGF